jgi:hypothetical protein
MLLCLLLADLRHEEIENCPGREQSGQPASLITVRLTNTPLISAGFSTDFGDQLLADQAAGVSSAIRLIGKFAKPGRIEQR